MKPKIPIRVAMAEDNIFLARSIQEKLELFPDEIRLVLHARDGLDLCEHLEKDHRVDVILMDIEMPRMDGIAAAEIIRRRHPQIRIIMLTVFDDEDRIFRSIRAGANGYLLKEDPPDRLRDGIRAILTGGAPMSPVIAAKTLGLLRNADVPDRSAEPAISLSAREKEVLEQLSQGLDYKAIAENLFISPATVRKHIEHIYGKLQVSNKIRAVDKAKKHRLI